MKQVGPVRREVWLLFRRSFTLTFLPGLLSGLCCRHMRDVGAWAGPGIVLCLPGSLAAAAFLGMAMTFSAAGRLEALDAGLPPGPAGRLERFPERRLYPLLDFFRRGG